LLAALVAAALPAGAVGGGRVSVAREATVSGEVIHLGEIAVLEGEAAERLGGVVIGAAPAAGESRRLDGRLVLQALRREGVDLDALAYTVPPALQVRRSAQEVDPGTVRAAIERFLAETVGAEGGEAVLRAVEVPGPIRIPSGDYEVRVATPPGTALVGRVRLQIEVLVDGRPAKSVWVTADVGLVAPVVVLRRPVARGEAIAAEDLTVDRRDLAGAPRGVLVRVEEAAGMVARAALPAWTPVRREQLAPPSVVRRGDVVLLVAERGALRVTAPGEVRDDAGLGQQVRVTNRRTRRELVGRVVDPSTVAVEF
jgi:flagella basal body P-ring formation protein FlgA